MAKAKSDNQKTKKAAQDAPTGKTVKATTAAASPTDKPKAKIKKVNGKDRRAPLSKRPPKLDVQPIGTRIKPASEKTITEAMEELDMKPSQIAFVEAYLTCFNGTRAWKAVYGAKTDNSAATCAAEALRKPHIRAYLVRRMKESFEDAESARDRLIQQFENMAYGDVNEIAQYRRECCRFCYGLDFKYQRTPQQERDALAQYEAVVREAVKANKSPPVYDPQGGVGFDPRREPNPDCPECFGEGEGKVTFSDTRHLSPAAQALYAGAEIGKDGIKVKTIAQDRARENLARILKLFEDKVEVNVNFDEDELSAKFQERIQRAMERSAEVAARRGGQKVE